MIDQFSQYWWILGMRGVVVFLFGASAILWPGITIAILVTLFGLTAILDGLLLTVTAINDRTTFKQWWTLLIQGVLAIAVGIATFVWPGISALVLLGLIALWAVLLGGFHITTAIRLRETMSGNWIFIVGGVISVLFGIFLFFSPSEGALAVIWLIGIYAIVLAFALIVGAFKLKKLDSKS